MRRILAAVVVLACALLMSACGGEEEGSAGGDCAQSDADTKIIKIRFADGEVTPSGERIEVEVCQPVDLVVASDASGSIHVHSTPEQELPYTEGEDTFALQFDRPGVVEVESHELDQVIIQLEVVEAD